MILAVIFPILIYRIRLIDENGLSVYSDLIFWERKWVGPIIGLHPNPATAGTQAVLEIRSAESGDGDIQVLDARGRILYEQRLLILDPDEISSWKIPAFSRGLYWVNIRLNDWQKTIFFQQL